MVNIVRLTESDLARIVRRVISEEMEGASGDTNWSKIYAGLNSISPYVISFDDEDGKTTSLNWGMYGGKKKPWGVTISSTDSELQFATKDPDIAKKYTKLTGRQLDKSGLYHMDEYPLNYSNPEKTISTVKSIISGLG